MFTVSREYFIGLRRVRTGTITRQTQFLENDGTKKTKLSVIVQCGMRYVQIFFRTGLPAA